MNEFLQIWALGGEATLNLSTSNGITNVSFNCTIGQPGAPHSLPPSTATFPSPTSPPHQPRHRGPRERERNRLRAACHQAAKAKATSQVSPSPAAPAPSTDPATAASSTVSVAAASTVPVTAPTSTDSVAVTVPDPVADLAAANLTFKCDQCSFTSNTDKGLKTHTRMKHRISQLDGLEDDGELNMKPCPLCPEGELCTCGNCEECSYILTEIGLNDHIMNGHEPPDVKQHFGVDWIHQHKHLISRNYADSAQDRYHSKKWDSFMVL